MNRPLSPWGNKFWTHERCYSLCLDLVRPRPVATIVFEDKNWILGLTPPWVYMGCQNGHEKTSIAKKKLFKVARNIFYVGGARIGTNTKTLKTDAAPHACMLMLHDES